MKNVIVTIIYQKHRPIYRMTVKVDNNANANLDISVLHQ